MKPGLKTPFFLILLPAFFFLHGLLENYNLILVRDTFSLFLIYFIVALLLTIFFWLIYKNIQKAALASFTLMSVNFFFGSFYDFIKRILPDSIITRFIFILPMILILISVILILIRKSKKNYVQICLYLNILFAVLTVLDVIALLPKISKNKINQIAGPVTQFNKCDTCSKPDIYLIVADEYAGKTELKDLFSFENSDFETKLQDRGFHILNNSAANYNSTVYSMASMLTMNYLKNLDTPTSENYKDILHCLELIEMNSTTSFLKKNGYQILNFSFFDIGKEKRVVNNILTTNKTILAGSTLLNRLRYLFGAKLASQKKLDKIKKQQLSDNIKIESLFKESFQIKSEQPRFVYAHFNMPHWHYYFDSAGTETPLSKLTEDFKANKTAYIEYLKYTNKKLLDLTDMIKKNAAHPPIIILVSDHGFRQLPVDIDKKYYFMNLSSVYLPSGNYSNFYDGMTNVNLMRALLNTCFSQELNLLPDSSCFIKDY